MTGRGHHATGLAAGIGCAGLLHMFVAGAPWWFAPAAGWFGGIAPDALEWLGPVRIIAHRTITHWWLIWAVLAAFGAAHTGTVVGVTALATGSGGLMHALTDWPNPMGVPLFLPWRRHSLNWWRSGRHEFLLIVAAFGLAALTWGNYLL